ncbi:MAG: methylenetetrahydrofolate reductase C-terminal domain-containing protein [Frankia sp.]
MGAFGGGDWVAAVARCPKRMAHGPCAGVDADGSCEVPGFGPCSFLEPLVAGWPDAGAPRTGAVFGRPGTSMVSSASAAFLAAAAARPVVVADLPAPALSARGLRDSARELADAVDACLLGDHGGARTQFPSSYRARLLADEGIAVWAGVNCRDRNRVALEGEIAACVDAGVVGLHCVTGDHPLTGHRPDAAPVFDLDSVETLELARSRGVLCSVAHAPAAPPVRHRLARLLTKVDAGADVVFVDHCGGLAAVADAVAGLRATGFGGLVLVCVPVVTNAASAEVIRSFAGARLPRGYLERIERAPDPATAGVEASVELTRAMLGVAGVDGVNLSGGTHPGEELEAARAMADISRQAVAARPAQPAWPGCVGAS